MCFLSGSSSVAVIVAITSLALMPCIVVACRDTGIPRNLSGGLPSVPPRKKYASDRWRSDGVHEAAGAIDAPAIR
ncbi:hypothetical protein Vau01_119620 [Virgisporangium aurantiacum]|uniref:Uncharacterized protein n=1 Tax=Virgisporangium aurantiacum TaxID=175570 RepID=A0A8J3ZMU8_9ACTN|nr:hypothetical protein Vau01_119620 [Virgisporangium aurantiacum]